jgi:hypothetical protein
MYLSGCGHCLGRSELEWKWNFLLHLWVIQDAVFSNCIPGPSVPEVRGIVQESLMWVWGSPECQPRTWGSPVGCVVILLYPGFLWMLGWCSKHAQPSWRLATEACVCVCGH